MSILNKIDKNCSCKHDIQQSEQTVLAVLLKSRNFYFPFLICSITFKIQIVGGNYTQKSGVHIPTPESHFFVFFSFNFQILLKNLNLFCLTTFDYLFFQKLNKTCWKYICLLGILLVRQGINRWVSLFIFGPSYFVKALEKSCDPSFYLKLIWRQTLIKF